MHGGPRKVSSPEDSSPEDRWLDWGLDLDQVVALPRREVWKIQQRWRRRYSLNVHRSTGSWTCGQFDWQTFHSGYCECDRAGQAVIQMESRLPCAVYVLLDGVSTADWGVAATLVSYEQLVIPDDIIVSAVDYSWTFAVTHSNSGGPFYSDDTQC